MVKVSSKQNQWKCYNLINVDFWKSAWAVMWLPNFSICLNISSITEFSTKERRRDLGPINDSVSVPHYTLPVCCYHVTYAFQSESILYICLNVKERLARNRRGIWCLSDCNGTRTHNHLVRKRTLNTHSSFTS